MLILDCCYSGAVTGHRWRGGLVGRGLGEAFQGSGHGRTILTSTTASMVSYAGRGASGDSHLSVLTRHLVGGLWAGALEGFNSLAEARFDDIVVVPATASPSPGWRAPWWRFWPT